MSKTLEVVREDGKTTRIECHTVNRESVTISSKPGLGATEFRANDVQYYHVALPKDFLMLLNKLSIEGTKAEFKKALNQPIKRK